MEDTLTEIGSYSLFHEYLNVVGVDGPSPPKVRRGGNTRRPTAWWH